jgi:hypothetical protein
MCTGTRPLAIHRPLSTLIYAPQLDLQRDGTGAGRRSTIAVAHPHPRGLRVRHAGLIPVLRGDAVGGVGASEPGTLSADGPFPETATIRSQTRGGRRKVTSDGD